MAWVYIRLDSPLPGADTYAVGHYDPLGHWHPEPGEHLTAEAAAQRCHYLNGGNAGPSSSPPALTSPRCA